MRTLLVALGLVACERLDETAAIAPAMPPASAEAQVLRIDELGPKVVRHTGVSRVWPVADPDRPLPRARVIALEDPPPPWHARAARLRGARRARREPRWRDRRARFAELRLWADRDGDRRSSPSELRPLAEVIDSLPLAHEVVPRCTDGGCEGERAAITWRDARGQARAGAVIDVYLRRR